MGLWVPWDKVMRNKISNAGGATADAWAMALVGTPIQQSWLAGSEVASVSDAGGRYCVDSPSLPQIVITRPYSVHQLVVTDAPNTTRAMKKYIPRMRSNYTISAGAKLAYNVAGQSGRSKPAPLGSNDIEFI